MQSTELILTCHIILFQSCAQFKSSNNGRLQHTGGMLAVGNSASCLILWLDASASWNYYRLVTYREERYVQFFVHTPFQSGMVYSVYVY